MIVDVVTGDQTPQEISNHSQEQECAKNILDFVCSPERRGQIGAHLISNRCSQHQELRQTITHLIGNFSEVDADTFLNKLYAALQMMTKNSGEYQSVSIEQNGIHPLLPTFYRTINPRSGLIEYRMPITHDAHVKLIITSHRRKTFSLTVVTLEKPIYQTAQ